MKIKNLTNSPRELNVTAYTKNGIREFSIYVLGNSEVDIEEGVVVNNLQVLLASKSIKILAPEIPVAVQAPVVKKVEKVDVPEEVEKQEETVEEPPTDPDEITCKICGDPFNTKRGLQMHMRVKHPENK